MTISTPQEKLLQAKLDARCSVFIHKEYIHRIDRKLIAIELLSLIVPIMFFAIELVFANDLPTRKILSSINYVISAVLISMVIWSMSGSFREKLKSHQRFLTENLPIINEIDVILRKNTIDQDDENKIIDKTINLTTQESLLLPKLPIEEKQFFYREVLKEELGKNAICGVCSASPWVFIKGSCQACGNQPKAGVNIGPYPPNIASPNITLPNTTSPNVSSPSITPPSTVSPNVNSPKTTKS